MFSTALLTLALAAPAANLAAPQDAPAVTLARVFTKGEKQEWEVTGELTTEVRSLGYETFFPQDISLRYRFTTEVEALEADGIARLRYRRPAIVQVTGETPDEPSQTTTERLNQNLLLQVSPINEILSVKDETPKPPARPGARPGGASGGGGNANLLFARSARQDGSPMSGFVDRFVGEVYRLALGIGPLDTSFDFAPKLPLQPVKVGDTWKRTVSYQPQTLQGRGRQAVQRLDLTYRYDGPMTVDGRAIQRVSASLSLKTDLAAFFNQTFEITKEQSGLSTIPLEVRQNVEFDLDPKTFRTLRAVSNTEGSFAINVTISPDRAIQEEKFRGRTVLRPISGTRS